MPAMLGHYRVEGVLGRGGMGVVHRAWDTRLGRPVVLKIVGDGDARSIDAARLEREARALATLNHPNVATVYGLESHEGAPIVVLEYIEGETLAERLKRGALPLGETLRTCEQVAAALEAVHGRNVIHRDLKPANVMLLPDGRVKLVDFGLAVGSEREVAHASLERVTSEETLVGTAGYMSPEHLRGEPLGPAADTWALGCVLYECLAGAFAFPGATWAERVASTLHGEPDWSLVPASAPPAVRELLRQCLERHPAIRLADAAWARQVLHAARALVRSSTSAPTERMQAGPRTTFDGEAADASSRSVRTLLLSDLVDSTALVARLGDGRAAELFARHDRVARDLMAARAAREIDKSDGFLVLFDRPVDAVRHALAYHAALARLAEEEGVPIAARVGIHLGDIALRRNAPRDVERGAKPLEVEGLAKATAARIMSLAGPGQTLLSRTAYDVACRAARDGDELPAHLEWRSHGRYLLKGVDEAVEVFEVGVAGLSPLEPPSATAKARPQRDGGGLPSRLSTFIGRKAEIETAASLLRTARVMTITGPGGVGKTRLALEVAGRLVDAHAGGAELVSFAELSEPALVRSHVAQALGVKERAGHSLDDELDAFLRGSEILLVLDNCEHLRDAIAPFAQRALEHARGVRVLATSREPLGMEGEQVFSLDPMALPAEGAGLAAIAAADAVQLFVDRASLVRPGFSLTAENGATISALCRRLDGIALAVELAAARVKALSPEDILRRLDDRFLLLTGGGRTAPPRQQALRATLDWSHDLLGDAERMLFRRLSVFAGGWTLEQAEEICSGASLERSSILDLLAQLVDRSLVQARQENDATRHSLLSTMRDYAREHLARSGEAAELALRHRDAFLSLAETAAPALLGSSQASWLARLEAERPNLLAALDTALSASDDGASALRLASALRRFWELRGHYREGRSFLERAIERGGGAPVGLRARATNDAAALARRQGDRASRHLFEEALALNRAAGDRRGEATCLHNLGVEALGGGRLDEAARLLEESLATFRELGAEREVAGCCMNLALVASARGDVARARELQERALSANRRLGDESEIARSLAQLGVLAQESGDLDRARSLSDEALAIHRRLGARASIASDLNNLATIAQSRGDLEAASHAYAEALELHVATGDRLSAARSRHGLAQVKLEAGALDDARSLLLEALSDYREAGDRAAVSMALDTLAEVERRHGDTPEAARLLGAADRMRQDLGWVLPPLLADARSRTEDALRDALGPEELARLRQAGTGDATDETVRRVLARRVAAP